MQISPETILEMPNAVLLVERVKSRLADERKRRRHFYEIVEDKTIEFINGDFFRHSPSNLTEVSANNLLLLLLDTFVIKNQLGSVGHNKLLISLSRNDYMPDICFFGNEKSKSFTAKQMKFPAPDFVVEVLSKSTAKADREIKFQDYAAHCVGEYWIVDAETQTVEQYFLQNEQYELLLKAKDGAIESVVLPKFKIPIRAIFDEAENLKTLVNLISE
jgi:Uma2 family endonuclease